MEAKERILQKSHELFNRYGIRSVSMDDIATQLGMSKKTLYQYYTDKDELVSAVIEAEMQNKKLLCLECRKKKENAIHEVFLSLDTVREMLSNMNTSLLFDLQKYHPAAFKKFLDFKNEFLYKIIKTNLEQGVAEGVYREEIDVEILTRYRLYGIMVSCDPAVFPGNKFTILQIEEQLKDHFLYGVATAKGQKLIQKYKNQRNKK